MFSPYSPLSLSAYFGKYTTAIALGFNILYIQSMATLGSTISSAT